VHVLDEPILWLACQSAATFSGNVVRRIEYGRTWGPIDLLTADQPVADVAPEPAGG
jgi:hypothetical protein